MLGEIDKEKLLRDSVSNNVLRGRTRDKELFKERERSRERERERGVGERDRRERETEREG